MFLTRQTFQGEAKTSRLEVIAKLLRNTLRLSTRKEVGIALTRLTILCKFLKN